MNTPELLPRVSYLTSYPVDLSGPLTGPQRVMRDVIGAVRARGVDLEVWSTPYDRSARRIGDVVDDGVSVHFVGPLAAIDAATRHPESVLHIGSFSLFHALPLVARRILGRFREIGPVVYTANGLLAIESRHGARTVRFITPWVERLLLTRSDHVVVLSTQMADLVANRYPVPAERITVAPTIVPGPFGECEPRGPKTPTPVPRFVYAGEFRDVKALDVLVRALDRLHQADSNRPWTMVFAGAPHPSWRPPPGWDHLQRLGRIEVLGSLPSDELADAYASSLCLVLASRYEPFGMVALEAMACGTPTIISDRVGARDLIEDGVSGIVVPFGDDEALGTAMSQALDDPTSVMEMGLAARRRVLATTRDSVASCYLGIYAT